MISKIEPQWEEVGSTSPTPEDAIEVFVDGYKNPKGDDRSTGLRGRRRRNSQILLPQPPLHCRKLPYVPCRGREVAQARRFLHHARSSRGMNYLHENRPEAIIHRDLEPSNILRDDSGHLKVVDFGVSKLLKVTSRVKEDRPLTCHDTSCRYVAPEVFRNDEYDTKVDVFSFALILQEMIEGCPPFSAKQENEVPKAYCTKKRPPFRAPIKHYSHGLKELIEECWSEEPAKRPTFRQIIARLEKIYSSIGHKRHWKVRTLKCFQNLEAMWKKDSRRLSKRSHSSRSTSIT